MTNARYEPRYCAFIDILGFRDLVGKSSAGETPFLFLKDLLTKVHNPPKMEVGLLTYNFTDFHVQSISDAVAISTKPSAQGLLQIFTSLEQLTTQLLAAGYFIRGAIVKGSLYHDNNMVFGEALVKAYGLEQEVVRYPRIMVASDVLSEAFTDDQLGHLVRDGVRQAEDGPWHVHTLRHLERFLRLNASMPLEGSAQAEELGRWFQMHSQIERRIGEAADTPRRFEKVQWFARYWNRTIDPFGGQIYLRIDGPGLPYPPQGQDHRIPQ